MGWERQLRRGEDNAGAKSFFEARDQRNRAPTRSLWRPTCGACHRKPKLGTWSSLLAQKCGSSLPLWVYIDLRLKSVKQTATVG
jgi:hypothetical protein